MGNWLQIFTPTEYVASVYDIDLDKLYRAGKRVILSDLDNTLVPWNDPRVPSPLQRWLAEAVSKGFQVCIVSNNKGPRVEAFAKQSGIDWIGAAKKPKPDAFLEALARFGAKPKEAIMVGDQLFTDIRGGNRAGLYTILVLPIHPKEWWGTQVVRIAERYVMQRLVRQGMQVPARRQ